MALRNYPIDGNRVETNDACLEWHYRLVVLLSLATAMITGMAMGAYSGKETGELALLRELFDQ
ncbi:MAG: hypothetical protein ACC645_05945, partial [Pirellulales bacterium]